MAADIVRENTDFYLGENARKEWSLDQDLYPSEVEIIERHFPAPPAKILDLGCGAGRTTLGLEARGFDVEAMDLSTDLVDEAQKRVTRSRVRVMDARFLDYPDASFDAALFSFNGLDCVYPARERLRVLADVYRVLRPGGIFYYSGHNAIGAFAPRPGDTLRKTLRRNRDLLRAQRGSFEEHGRYLRYPEPSGMAVLYSALPHVHFAEQRATGFRPLAAYGSRSYRLAGLDPVPEDSSRLRHLGRLGRVALLCPHVHYLAQKVAD